MYKFNQPKVIPEIPSLTPAIKSYFSSKLKRGKREMGGVFYSFHMILSNFVFTFQCLFSFQYKLCGDFFSGFRSIR